MHDAKNKKRPFRGSGHSIMTYRSFKKFKIFDFQNDLSASQIHLIETEHDPEQALLLFYNILYTILSKHAPMKSKRIKSNHLPRWINHEVKKAMYERDRFHKLKDWYNYEAMRNNVLHLIRKKKKD